MLGINLSALEFGPDHVHLFLEDCKNFSVSKLVQHFKGYSSRLVRKEFWDLLQERHPGRSFWTSGNFHESIGNVTEEHVKYYIEKQQKKHWQHHTHEEYNQSSMTLLKSQTRLTMFSSQPIQHSSRRHPFQWVEFHNNSLIQMPMSGN